MQGGIGGDVLVTETESKYINCLTKVYQGFSCGDLGSGGGTKVYQGFPCGDFGSGGGGGDGGGSGGGGSSGLLLSINSWMAMEFKSIHHGHSYYRRSEYHCKEGVLTVQ